MCIASPCSLSDLSPTALSLSISDLSIVVSSTWSDYLQGVDTACPQHCRPAAAEVTPGAASTAIPAHVDSMGDDHTRYLVSVKPSLVATNSSRLLGSRGSRRSSLLLQSSRQPFDDVKLGPLLGKGGFGRVYRAVWNGAAVACKVITAVACMLLDAVFGRSQTQTVTILVAGQVWSSP